MPKDVVHNLKITDEEPILLGVTDGRVYGGRRFHTYGSKEVLHIEVESACVSGVNWYFT
jgi:hypothetical protein